MTINDYMHAQVAQKIDLALYLSRPDGSKCKDTYLDHFHCGLCRYIRDRKYINKKDVHYIILDKLHDYLHTLSSELIVKANNGEKIDTMALMGANGPFSNITTEIVRILMLIEDKCIGIEPSAINLDKYKHDRQQG